MPNWNLDEYRPIKDLVTDYVNGLNNRNYQLLAKHLSADCIMAKNSALKGVGEVIKWFENTFDNEDCRTLKFELVDASANFFSTTEAQVLLYLQIFKDFEPQQIHIESLYLSKSKEVWKISRIFGLGFDPESHSEYFKPFLKLNP